ncbi:hypothetical protein BX667DRAFT_505877 [Coemansia mojavensis]|nr:hypothetical protein BX667DRAFT_505877 [Coemansia mojavensis]
MAYFTSLPDDIILLILYQLVGYELEKPRIFGGDLSLLAICSRWRQLALPLVYKYVFITYSKCLDIMESFERKKLCNYTEPNDADIFTNADLAKNAGDNLARTVTIDVHYIMSPVKGLTKVMQMLKSSVSNAQKLNLTLRPWTLDRHHIIQTNGLASAANDLAKLMPHVKNIFFGGYCQLAKVFSEYLADRYAHQILVLRSEQPIQTTNFFSKLETMYMNVSNEYEYLMPHINIETLKHLIIKDGFIDFNFLHNGEIVLPKLKYLCLDHAHRMPLNFIPLRLVLPQLEYLIYDISCSIIERIVLPESMKMLDISTSSAIFKALSKMKLPNCNNVKLSTTSGERDDNVIIYMNRVLTNMGKPQKAHLKIHYDLICVEHFTCKHVTDLEISSYIGMDTVIGLLDKLPELNKLRLKRVTSYRQAMGFGNAIDDSLNPLNFYNTRDLSLSFRNCSYKLEVDFTIYLIVRMLLLREIHTPNVSQTDLFKGLNAFVLDCPHIKNVKFIFFGRRVCYFD